MINPPHAGFSQKYLIYLEYQNIVLLSLVALRFDSFRFSNDNFQMNVTVHHGNSLLESDTPTIMQHATVCARD